MMEPMKQSLFGIWIFVLLQTHICDTISALDEDGRDAG